MAFCRDMALNTPYWSWGKVLIMVGKKWLIYLLTAKLDAFRFANQVLAFVYSYLSNHKQRTKINNAFLSCSYIIYGNPKGSILGSLLVNICDIFVQDLDCDISNYTDNNSAYTSNHTWDTMFKKVKNCSILCFSGLKPTLWK